MLEYSERTLYGKVVDAVADQVHDARLDADGAYDPRDPDREGNFEGWAAWKNERRSEDPQRGDIYAKFFASSRY